MKQTDFLGQDTFLSLKTPSNIYKVPTPIYSFLSVLHPARTKYEECCWDLTLNSEGTYLKHGSLSVWKTKYYVVLGEIDTQKLGITLVMG